MMSAGPRPRARVEDDASEGSISEGEDTVRVVGSNRFCRNPRHYTVTFDDLEDGVQRLVSCPRQVMPNAYHDA
jgi:hypothetical protein